jgi:hypothetical protein
VSTTAFSFFFFLSQFHACLCRAVIVASWGKQTSEKKATQFAAVPLTMWKMSGTEFSANGRKKTSRRGDDVSHPTK